MVEHGMYFAKDKLYRLIREHGGEWNDSKKRPIVCLVESTEQKGLYWAIPIGDYDHRTSAKKARIQSFIDRPERDIGSCYYHLGRTNKRTIFFISDIIPITDNYIEREYIVGPKMFIIRNPKLLAELNRKITRILSYENSHPNFFRQHITDVKNALIGELS